MKNTKVTLVPLTADDREQFILDNQWAFKYGAIEEFGKRDDHVDCDGEIISRKTIEHCIDSPDSEILTAYVKDLGLGLLFAVVGVIYYLAMRERKNKRKRQNNNE